MWIQYDGELIWWWSHQIRKLSTLYQPSASFILRRFVPDERIWMLERTVSKIFYAAQLIVIEESHSVFHQKIKQDVSSCVALRCVYMFPMHVFLHIYEVKQSWFKVKSGWTHTLMVTVSNDKYLTSQNMWLRRVIGLILSQT